VDIIYRGLISCFGQELSMCTYIHMYIHGSRKLICLILELLVLTETVRRTHEGNVEVSFHLSHEVVKALKLRAVEEEKKFSKVAEAGLRQYLGLKELKEKTNEKKPRSISTRS
jgi:hypothetical protein